MNDNDDLNIFFNDNEKYNVRVAILIKSGDKILFSRKKGRDIWLLPGGREKFFESSLDTIKREMYEEIGLKLKNPILKTISEQFFEYEGTKYHELLWIYQESRDDIDTNDVILSKEDNDEEYKWFKIDELDDINVLPLIVKESVKNKEEGIKHFVVKDV